MRSCYFCARRRGHEAAANGTPSSHLPEEATLPGLADVADDEPTKPSANAFTCCGHAPRLLPGGLFLVCDGCGTSFATEAKQRLDATATAPPMPAGGRPWVFHRLHGRRPS